MRCAARQCRRWRKVGHLAGLRGRAEGFKLWPYELSHGDHFSTFSHALSHLSRWSMSSCERGDSMGNSDTLCDYRDENSW